MSSCVFPLSANRVKILQESLHVDFDLNRLFIYCFHVDINDNTTFFHSFIRSLLPNELFIWRRTERRGVPWTYLRPTCKQTETTAVRHCGANAYKVTRLVVEASGLLYFVCPPHIYMYIIIFKFLSLEIQASNSTVFNQQLQEVEIWCWLEVLLQVSAGTDTADCYQHFNVQFKAKNMIRVLFKHLSCLDPIYRVIFFVCDWYKYRYMVILLFATTTRCLSMQMEFG